MAGPGTLDDRSSLPALLESARDGFAVLGPEGIVRSANHAFLELFGLASDDVGCIDWHGLLSPEHRDDLSAPELREVLLAGPVRWIERQLSALPGGEVLVQARDVTARRLAEHDLRLTRLCVESANVSVFRIDDSGRILGANAAACASLGYTREEILALRVFDVDPNFTREMWQEHRRRVRDQGSRTIETRHRRKDGTTFPVEITVTQVRFEDQAFTFTIGRDITERIEARAARRQAYEDVQRALATQERLARRLAGALDAKSAFMARMSHELRTPMNGVLGVLDLLAASMPEGETGQLVEMAQVSARSLLRVIEDVLEFAVFDDGRIHLEPGEVDLRRLAAEVLREFREALEAKGLALELSIAAGVPCCIRGDERRLRQIFFKLLDNAVKFTDHGSVECRVEPATHGDTAGLCVTVRDTGIGIPPAKHAAIFEPFEQADTSNTRRHGGSGLGLAIVRQLVDAMGGRIELESAPGAGSTFRVWLPTEACGEEPPRPLEVLVVEDNPINQRVIRGLLDRAGHHVTVAADGREALQRHAERPFDLVLMDGSMPNLDGFEATRLIRARESATGSRTPILAVTASATADDTERFLDAGADEVVTKPVNPSAVNDAIARLARITRK